MNVIEINGLHKSFGDVHAVNDLSFKVKQGELFAFLGVNGAGKSTTISIMCGTLIPDNGSIHICELDALKQIGDYLQYRRGVSKLGFGRRFVRKGQPYVPRKPVRHNGQSGKRPN